MFAALISSMLNSIFPMILQLILNALFGGASTT